MPGAPTCAPNRPTCLVLQNQLSGNLLRKFKNSNGWQKLWVVFTNFCLFFYKSPQVRAWGRWGPAPRTLPPWGHHSHRLPVKADIIHLPQGCFHLERAIVLRLDKGGG